MLKIIEPRRAFNIWTISLLVCFLHGLWVLPAPAVGRPVGLGHGREVRRCSARGQGLGRGCIGGSARAALCFLSGFLKFVVFKFDIQMLVFFGTNKKKTRTCAHNAPPSHSARETRNNIKLGRAHKIPTEVFPRAQVIGKQQQRLFKFKRTVMSK